jgi:hypothetical protein
MSQANVSGQKHWSWLTRVALAVIALNVALVVFLMLTKWTPLTRPAPKVLHGGTAFESSAKLPPDEVKSAFEQAADAKDTANQSGNRWNLAAYLLDWAAFLLSTAITAIAAFFGESAAGAEGATIETQLAQLRAHSRLKGWIIGLVAAAIAASTTISTRAHSEAKAAYKRADDLVAAMDQSRAVLANNAIGESEQRRALQRLNDLVARTGE